MGKGRVEGGKRLEMAEGIMEERLMEMETGIEMRKRKKKKRNTIFRNVEIKERKERKTVEFD